MLGNYWILGLLLQHRRPYRVLGSVSRLSKRKLPAPDSPPSSAIGMGIWPGLANQKRAPSLWLQWLAQRWHVTTRQHQWDACLIARLTQGWRPPWGCRGRKMEAQAWRQPSCPAGETSLPDKEAGTKKGGPERGQVLHRKSGSIPGKEQLLFA